MTQKSNITTLRSPESNLNLRTTIPKEFLELNTFINLLKHSLLKKDVLCTALNINKSNNVIYLELNLFFKTKKLARLKKKIRKTKAKNIKKHSNIKKIFAHNLKNNAMILKFKLINKEIVKKKTFRLYNQFKRLKNILFARRFTLFLDCLKIISLFMDKKVNVDTFLYMLGSILSLLPKRRHSTYFTFLKQLFTRIIHDDTSKVKGIKFLVKGKIKGKPRSNTEKIIKGNISNQTISNNVTYHKLHVYTIYGAFGLKMWAHYK